MQHAFKTSELSPDERAAMERLLGRNLRPDETVELVVHKQQDAQEAAVRATAAARIRVLAKGKGIGGLTIRELIEDGRRS